MLFENGIAEDSYGRGLLVLDQCESTQPDDNSKGLVELARSTLLLERFYFWIFEMLLNWFYFLETFENPGDVAGFIFFNLLLFMEVSEGPMRRPLRDLREFKT